MTSRQAEALHNILASTKATDQQIILAALRSLELLGANETPVPVSEAE